MWGQVNYKFMLCLPYRIIPTRVGTRTYYKRQRYKPWDHPHACGDKQPADIPLLCLSGSSPRVWGQDRWAVGYTLTPRIIPTRVGTRTCYSSCNTNSWDHPHACGDKISTLSWHLTYPGSSPRVWGQELFSYRCWSQQRIIPTRVGTRQNGVEGFDSVKDHPHACGDKASDLPSPNS